MRPNVSIWRGEDARTEPPLDVGVNACEGEGGRRLFVDDLPCIRHRTWPGCTGGWAEGLRTVRARDSPIGVYRGQCT
jgi:hypothetical protein